MTLPSTEQLHQDAARLDRGDLTLSARLLASGQVAAAKTALEAIFVWISCPGTRANQGESAAKSRSDTPERCISSPIMMNIGAAIRMKSLEWLHMTSPEAAVIGMKAKFSDKT